jgi:hypothetical protein
MKRFALLLTLMLLATPAFAATARKPARTATATLWSEFVKHLEVSAGWRFTPEHGRHETEVDNQFYVGTGARLPLANSVALFAAYDHDFTEQNDWQARAGISFMPFGGRY